MKRPSYKLILLVGFLCLFGAMGIALAVDPTPAAVAQKTSASDATPAPAAPVATVVPAPAVVTASGPATGNDTISLDFKDAEIGSVLRVLSMKSNVNIVTGPEVKGLVTVRLYNVPWEKALDVILRTYDYVFERDGNIIRVTTRDKMKQEPVETKTFILNYSKAKDIQASIRDILSEKGKSQIAERTNMVVVTDIPTNLYRIGEIIKKLDKLTQQAYIDSKVVRTEAGKADNLGIQWNPQVSASGAKRPTTFPFTQDDAGTPASLEQFFPVTSATIPAINPVNSRAFPLSAATTATVTPFTYGTLDFSSFTATLRLLESYSNTKIVSNPRIVVLNNQTANIQVGTDYPIPSFERNEQTGSMEITGFNYRELGVVLNVTPHINSAEEILVDLKPEVSSAGALIPLGTGTAGFQAPSFNVTKAQTQVLIQSGQTIAIGGLMSDNVASTEDKVPYLANLPLVGKLFRSKRQTAGDSNAKVETLFFVTVTMVDSQGQPAGAKVDGKNDQSQDAQTQKKTAATDAAPGLKGSEKTEPSENANKDKPA